MAKRRLPEDAQNANSNENAEARKRRLIHSALQQAGGPHASEFEETVAANAGSTSIMENQSLPICPSCFLEIESDPLLKSFHGEQGGSEEGHCPSCNTYFDFRCLEESLAVPKTIGSFQLTHRLGAGSFGQVWLAHDENLDRQVAVKFPRTGNVSPEFRKLFLQEAQNVAQLRHPNIVNVHDAGVDDGLVYIVSEYVESRSLDRVLRSKRFTFQEATELCIKVARALHSAHSFGIVHRDLKPSNILIDEHGEPYLTDFGLSKRDTSQSNSKTGFANASRKTEQPGKVLGTPAYMSPEQAEGRVDETDGRTDVYSLGVVLFELLTGERPFRGDPEMLVKNVVHEIPPTPRSLRNDVPRDLETVCLKCLEKKSSARYDSADELAEDLQRWVENRPVLARPAGKMERSLRWCQRNRLVATLFATILLTLLAGLAGVAWQWKKTSLALKVADAQTLRGNLLLGESQQIVDEFLLDISTNDSLLKSMPGTDKLRNQLLRKARQYYESLIKRESQISKSSLVRALSGSAQVSSNLKDLKRVDEDTAKGVPLATSLLEKGIDVHENGIDLFQMLNYRGRMFLTNHDLNAAEICLRQAVDESNKWLESFPNEPEGVSALTSSLELLGVVETQRCNPSGAVKYYESAETQLRQLAELNPELKWTHVGLASLQLNRAKHEDANQRDILVKMALENLGKSAGTPTDIDSLIAAIPNQPNDWSAGVAVVLNVGVTQAFRRDASELTAKLQREASRFYEAINQFDPDHTIFGTWYCQYLFGQAAIARAQLKPAKELAELQKAENILAKLLLNHADNFEFEESYINLQESFSEFHFSQGNRKKAIEYGLAALESRKRLASMFPEIPNYVYYVAKLHLSIGDSFLYSEKPESAIHHFQLAKENVDKAIDKGFPNDQTIQGALAYLYGAWAIALEENGEAAKGLEFGLKSLSIAERSRDADPTGISFQRVVVRARSDLGLRQMANDQYEDAIDSFLLSNKESNAIQSGDPRHDMQIGGNFVNIANCFQHLDQYDKAREYNEKAIESLDLMLRKHPNQWGAEMFLKNARSSKSRTIANQILKKIEPATPEADRLSPSELASALDEITSACEITQWEKGISVSTFAKVVALLATEDSDLDEWLEKVPQQKWDAIREQIKQAMSID